MLSVSGMAPQPPAVASMLAARVVSGHASANSGVGGLCLLCLAAAPESVVEALVQVGGHELDVGEVCGGAGQR